VTGGIASGKTTVCRILEKYGAYQLNSDDIIHQLLSEDKLSIDQVVGYLGSDVVSDGKVDRGRVAEVVFSDEQKLRGLEAILHPKLLGIIWKEYRQKIKLGLYRFFVVEMPLVQEIGKEKEFDIIVAVTCPEALAKERCTLSEREYIRRMRWQWPVEKKARYADYAIVNDGSIKELEQQLLEFIENLWKQTRRKVPNERRE